jgi:hypothetical protein
MEMKFMVFKTLTKETKTFDDDVEGTEDYDVFMVNDLDPGDTFIGKPVLGEIKENEFEDIDTGEMVKKYSASFLIINHDNKEKLKARVNLKSLNDDVTFWQGSLGYDIIDSIEEMHEPGTSGINNVYNMSFNELKEYINNLKTCTAEVKSYTGKFIYNTVRIQSAEA